MVIGNCSLTSNRGKQLVLGYTLPFNQFKNEFSVVLHTKIKSLSITGNFFWNATTANLEWNSITVL